MSVYELIRKTASRVYKRRNDAEELHPLQETIHQYSSSCYSLHQACIVGDVKAVRWYIENEKENINKPDKKGALPLFYAIQKNHVVLVKDLIEGGADVNLMTSLEEGINVAASHVAAKYNRCECMKILLGHGADPNARNLFGQAPLHAAARRKLNEIVKVLIEVGKANVNIPDHDKVTPLHLAATKRNDNQRKLLVRTLLENGANPFCEDNEGNTVFHEAAENGVDDVLEILFQYRGFEKCANFSSITEVLNKPRKDGYNCLHLAVENGHEKVIQMCIDYKADVNLKTLNGDAPLHIACTKGHLNASKILLDHGADLQVGDKCNHLPIHRAASKGHVTLLAYLIEKGTNIDVFHICGPALVAASYHRRTKAVKFLLEAGASVTIRNQLLDTCLHAAVKNGDVETVKVIMEKSGETLLELKDKHEKTALHLAAEKGNPEVLKILLSYNPDVRARDDREKCPIHIAAENGNLECAELLIKADKCAVLVTDLMWRTALHFACRNVKVLKLLLENGADVNARDDRRWTPLFYVALIGCPCATAVLVEHGAKIDEWDKNRMTALSVAASQNNAEAVKTLLEHGADPSILTCDGMSCMDIALQNRFHDVCLVIANSDKWKEALVSSTTMENCLEVSPEVAKVILDRCVEYRGRSIDKDYKVTYHFDLLDPNPDDNDSFYGPLAMKIAGRYELLTHPLTKKLLEVNWKNGVRYIYYSGMFVFAAALILLTLFLLWIRDIMQECYLAAHDSSTSQLSPKLYEDDYCSSEVKYDRNKMVIYRSLVFVYFSGYLIKEMHQLYIERWEYFTEISNILDMAGSILFLLFVEWPSEDAIPYQRFKFGILGIFANYFLMFLWTRGLTRSGIYITMFLEVLATLLRVLLGFALLFIGFSATFFLTVMKAEDFKSLHDSLLKVMAMMLGELDYTGYREEVDQLSPDMETIAIFIFVVFCFTMSVVVNNLLIGLAVGDIESVQKNAEIKLLSLQVSQIVEARLKMVRMLRRRYHVPTISEMPNDKYCRAEERRAEEYRKRNEKSKNKRKQVFQSMLDLAIIKNEHTL